ncbi:MAG: dicarboxylate/amino acid:cation symporter [Parvularculaceae bacterium]|nr:dicarboxylate/amino acid:cation symporter [Parvularculaceae bacterium]
MLKNLSTWVLLALVFGLGVGAYVQANPEPWLEEAGKIVEAVGALWLNLLRMTVVPLVFAILVTGIASAADAAASGRLALRAVLLFTVLIFGAAIYATVTAQAMLAFWPVDREAAAAFVAGVKQPDLAAMTPPGLAEWIKNLAPSNVIDAAANDRILPLVVFASFFGFALTRVEPRLRASLAPMLEAIAETMIKVVHWVLLAAPVGVFALSFGVGAHAGIVAAGVLAQYVVVVSGCIIGIIIVGYALAVLLARVPLATFARAMAPTTAVAFSTQSSLASLPAMLDSARALGVPERVRNMILPLAVAVFRFTSPVGNLAVVYFVCHLYGIEPTLAQMIAGVFVAFAASVAAVGLPGTTSFIVSIAPIALAVGAPIEILGVLIAVEVIPDIFRTIGNVTGDVMATKALARSETGGAAAQPNSAAAR